MQTQCPEALSHLLVAALGRQDHQVVSRQNPGPAFGNELLVPPMDADDQRLFRPVDLFDHFSGHVASQLNRDLDQAAGLFLVAFPVFLLDPIQQGFIDRLHLHHIAEDHRQEGTGRHRQQMDQRPRHFRRQQDARDGRPDGAGQSAGHRADGEIRDILGGHAEMFRDQAERAAGKRADGEDRHEDAAGYAASEADAGEEHLDRQEQEKKEEVAVAQLGEFDQVLPAAQHLRQQQAAGQDRQQRDHGPEPGCHPFVQPLEQQQDLVHGGADETRKKSQRDQPR